MRATILLLLFVSMLAGCVESGRGGYYDDGYYDNGQGYYHPNHQQRQGGTYYGNDQQNYAQQQRRNEANCNMNWQNCAGVCNTMANAQQRAVCVANCNNALNQCKGR